MGQVRFLFQGFNRGVKRRGDTVQRLERKRSVWGGSELADWWSCSNQPTWKKKGEAKLVRAGLLGEIKCPPVTVVCSDV